MKRITSNKIVKEKLHARYLELAQESGILKNPKVISLTAVYVKTDGWYIGSLTNVPGVSTQGKTLDEVRVNLIDALRLMASIHTKSGKKLKYINGLWSGDIPYRNSFSIQTINFKDKKKAYRAARLMNGWLERYFISERKAGAMWLETYYKSEFKSLEEYLYHAEFKKTADGKEKMIFRKKLLTPKEKISYNKTMTDYIRQQLPHPSKKKYRYLLGIWGPSAKEPGYHVVETISIPTKKRAGDVAIMLDAYLRKRLDNKFITGRTKRHEN